MDYATRNKRFLAEACEANGLPATGSPAELFATLSARSTTGVKRVKPPDMGPFIKMVYVQDEVKRMIAEDKLPDTPQLEREAEERWEVVKKQRLDGSEFYMPSDMGKDVLDRMHSEGYESVIIEPEGIYLRQTKKTKPSAEDLREQQDTEYAIAQVEDMKKEEAATLHDKSLTDTVSLESTMLALQDVISGKKKLSVDDFTGLVAPLIEKLDAVLPEDSKHVLRNLLSSHITTDTSAATAQENHADMGIVRRRLMDWLVINATSEESRMADWVKADGTPPHPALFVIAGLHDSEKMPAVASGLVSNPRVVASKLAYSIFPENEGVKPLNYDEKKLADTPQALWSESEIKLYGQKKDDLPVVQNPGDAAKEEIKIDDEDSDDEDVPKIGDIRVRKDGRKEKYCSRQLVTDGVPCKGMHRSWLLLPEDDGAAGEDSVAKMVSGEATETVDA